MASKFVRVTDRDTAATYLESGLFYLRFEDGGIQRFPPTSKNQHGLLNLLSFYEYGTLVEDDTSEEQ